MRVNIFSYVVPIHLTPTRGRKLWIAELSVKNVKNSSHPHTGTKSLVEKMRSLLKIIAFCMTAAFDRFFSCCARLFHEIKKPVNCPVFPGNSPQAFLSEMYPALFLTVTPHQILPSAAVRMPSDGCGFFSARGFPGGKYRQINKKFSCLSQKYCYFFLSI